MERIVLEVDDEVAKAWRAASVKLKTEINSILNKQLAKIIDHRKEKDIIQFLDEVREEMAAKGLTQEVLDDILRNEQ